MFIDDYELRDLIQVSNSRQTQSAGGKFTSDDHRKFYETNVVKSFTEISDICMHTKYQDNSSWRMNRSIRITGSSCYELYTYYRNKNADWTKKIQSYLSPKSLHTKAIQYGKEVEKFAFNSYKAKRNPLIKKCGFVISFEEPWMGVSPDGVDPLNRLLLEIKCPLLGADHGINWVIDECKATRSYIRRVESSIQLNRNHKYFAQVQLAMYVMKLPKCDFIVYSKFEDDFAIAEVDYDEAYTLQLVSVLKTVYFTHMLPQIVEREINVAN